MTPNLRLFKNAFALAVALFAISLVANLPGQWEVYGAPNQDDVTPRGTAPLLPPPPGATQVPPAVVATQAVPPAANTPAPNPQVSATEAPAPNPPVVSSPPPTPAGSNPLPATQAPANTPMPNVTVPQPAGPQPTVPSFGAPLATPTPFVSNPAGQPNTVPGAPAPGQPTPGRSTNPGSEPASGAALSQPVASATAVTVNNAPVRLEAGSPPVVVEVPAFPAAAPVTVGATTAVLSREQVAAAQRSGLTATNIAFTVGFQPVPQPVPNFQVNASYLPQQVAGMDANSLSVYRYDEGTQAWSALQGCRSETSSQRVNCASSQPGTFLLAGKAQPAARDGVSPALWVLGGLAVATLGTAEWLRRRRLAQRRAGR